MEKQSRFDRLKQKMAEVTGIGPRSILPHVQAPPTTSGASASGQAVLVPALTTPATPSPLLVVTKKRGSSKDPAGKPFPVQGGGGCQRGSLCRFKEEREEEESAGRFCRGGGFRGGLLVGAQDSWPLGAGATPRNGSTPCLSAHRLPSEKAFASKVQMEKELASLKDQVDVLTAERDSALAAPLLNTEIKSLTQRLEFSEGERLSALARMTEVEERVKVQAAELESCRAALLKEKREAEGLTKSLRERQTALDGAEAAAAHWRDEWKSLAKETGDMVQETFEILMDQVRHLNPAIDFSMIALDTRWDPKAKRIYNPKAETQEQSEPVAEEQPGPVAGVQIGGDAQEVVPEALVNEGGECPVPNM
ncbi:hypothetical protein PIB30_062266 [Stylosanthes scabra]|uniref:Uncharacterized protein n=1 Tax=Stylosanthes scabra TaxID=79078 RepID=A0ABU6QLU5_9FABA|nr:hypothetical protein [Stylosanthes scabra]